MAMEQGLYEQVVTICQKYLDNKKEEGKTKKYNFQGQSARSIHRFDLDRECLEENFSTRKIEFYLKNFIKRTLKVKR